VARLALSNVRFGSKADIEARQSDVRFTPESRHSVTREACPLCKKSGHAGSKKWAVVQVLLARLGSDLAWRFW
jgi:hypothetical protein